MMLFNYLCLEILPRVVWTSGNFENNFRINHDFTKYLKESCGLDFVQHFSLKYFLKNPCHQNRCFFATTGTNGLISPGCTSFTSI